MHKIVLKDIFSTLYSRIQQGFLKKQGLQKQLDQDRKEMPASFANT
jgi:hypothetical protein